MADCCSALIQVRQSAGLGLLHLHKVGHLATPTSCDPSRARKTSFGLQLRRQAAGQGWCSWMWLLISSSSPDVVVDPRYAVPLSWVLVLMLMLCADAHAVCADHSHGVHERLGAPGAAQGDWWHQGTPHLLTLLTRLWGGHVGDVRVGLSAWLADAQWKRHYTHQHCCRLLLSKICEAYFQISQGVLH